MKNNGKTPRKDEEETANEGIERGLKQNLYVAVVMKRKKWDKRLMNEVKRYSVPCPNYLHTTASSQEESSHTQVKILT